MYSMASGQIFRYSRVDTENECARIKNFHGMTAELFKNHHTVIPLSIMQEQVVQRAYTIFSCVLCFKGTSSISFIHQLKEGTLRASGMPTPRQQGSNWRSNDDQARRYVFIIIKL